MTKEEMLSEIKFPLLIPYLIYFSDMKDVPIENAWIFCRVKIKEGLYCDGLYKWQKENNPENIFAWIYINIESAIGNYRYIQDLQFSDDKVILIRDEKDKDKIIEIIPEADGIQSQLPKEKKQWWFTKIVYWIFCK